MQVSMMVCLISRNSPIRILRLNHWLFEETMVFGVWGVTVPNTLHILQIKVHELSSSEWGTKTQNPYLVLVENSVAYSCHKHHCD